MKQITCEMCGGKDIIKQNGVFVCQNCGMKYSSDDMKKIMIDGTVDVKGIIKIDTSDELANLYELARRAKNNENYKNASQYYNMILYKDPKSWEAAFYVIYCQAITCNVAGINSSALSLLNCIDSTLKIIYDYESNDLQEKAIEEITQECIKIANMFVIAARDNYYGYASEFRNQYTNIYINNLYSARDLMYKCGDLVEGYYNSKTNILPFACEAWKTGINIHKRILSIKDDKKLNINILEPYIKKISKYDLKYYADFRKEIISQKISSLNNEISQIPTSKSAIIKKQIYKTIKIFTIVTIIIFIIMLLVSLSNNIPFPWTIFLYISLFNSSITIIVSIFKIYNINNSDEMLNNKIKINNIKAEIDKLQKEYDTLK